MAKARVDGAVTPDPGAPVKVVMTRRVLWRGEDGHRVPQDLIEGSVAVVPRTTAAQWVLTEWAALADGEVPFSREELHSQLGAALDNLEAERRMRGTSPVDFERIPAVRRRLERMYQLVRPDQGPGGEAA